MSDMGVIAYTQTLMDASPKMISATHGRVLVIAVLSPNPPMDGARAAERGK